MNIRLATVVLDAADVRAESAFWAELLEGTVDESDGWHTVEANGAPRIAWTHPPEVARRRTAAGASRL